MKLTHVSIDQFGRWNGLDLPLDNEFSLFYGPNEAGKSTLLRFVRGVLFGFPVGSDHAAGEIRVEHKGETHTIRREAAGSGRGLLTVSKVGQGDKAERWIHNALGGVGEELFETVFAIGLNELQQLSSLDADEVAESIYGLSLGPEGERVMRASTLLHDARARLLDDDERGELVTLMRRRDELDAELSRLPDEWEHADKLTSEREELLRSLADADRNRDQLRHDLRGMNFMERVYAPWRKQQQLIEERNRLGLDDFPLDAPDRLLTVEERLNQLDDKRRQLKTDDARLKREYERIADRPELIDNACRVHSLLDEEPRVRDLRERLRDVDRDEQEAERIKAERLRSLGVSSVAEIDPPRLKRREASTPSVIAHHTDSGSPVSLLSEADAYRKVGRRYKSHLKRFRSAEAKQKRRSSDLKSKIRATGAKSLADAIAVSEKRLAEAETIRLLGHRERLLDLQIKNLKRAKPTPSSTTTNWSNSFEDGYEGGLPQQFGAVMFIYIVGGFVCFVGGIAYAITSAAVLGAAWTLLGLATLGTGLFLKEYFFGSSNDEGAGVDRSSKAAIRELEAELRKTRNELDRLDPTGESGLLYRRQSGDTKYRVRDNVDAQINKARQLVIDLKALAGEEEKIQKNRDVLSRMRTSLRGEKQALHNAKQIWARALRAAGLRETLKINDALEAWNRLQMEQFETQIAELTDALDAERRQGPQVVSIDNVDFDARRQLIKSQLERFEEQLNELAIRLNEPMAGADPFAWLRRLREQIDALERQKADRLRIRKERKEIRAKLEQIDAERSRFQSTRSDIYAEAGVTTKDEFEARAKAVSRASLLATQIDEAQQEVFRISQTETELAIVEDDLMTFDANQNKRAIDSTNAELAKLEKQIESWRERLGRVEREIDELMSERSTARLRFEREQVQGRLEELACDYLAAGVAADALDGVREQVEQNCQPETLRRAGHYLSKLTQGKYSRVWTQLGRRELLVKSDTGRDWTVAQLSTGTREQLFLAIRLAMAEEFAEQGGELPLVLDDVLVNFDQDRTEAAIDTLIDVAETGQQVLMFSCHLHVASLLEARGRDSVTLPGREAVRLAG